MSILLLSAYSFLFLDIWSLDSIKMGKNNWSNISPLESVIRISSISGSLIPTLKYCVKICNFVYTYLFKIDRQIHFVVLHSSGKRWWLPPGFHSIDRVFRWMLFLWVVRIAVIAYLDIDNAIIVLPQIFKLRSNAERTSKRKENPRSTMTSR